MKWLLRAGGACTALIAIGAVLAYVGSYIAWSSDIRRLDRQQADTAVEIYSNKVRGLLTIAPHVENNSPASRAWHEELNRARDQLRRSEDRRIELSK